jgi:hypothetical protein
MIRRVALPLIALLALGAFFHAGPAEAEAPPLVQTWYNKNGVRLYTHLVLVDPVKNAWSLRIFVENRNNRLVRVGGFARWTYTVNGRTYPGDLTMQRSVQPNSTTSWKPGTFRNLRGLVAGLPSVVVV